MSQLTLIGTLSDYRSYRLEEVSFCIVFSLANHCTMKREIEAVDRPNSFQTL